MLKFYDKNTQNELITLLKKRGAGENPEILASVQKIVNDVAENGDSAVKSYCEKFDGVVLDSFYMSEEEKQSIIAKVDDKLKATIDRAAKNIFAFHEKQKKQSWVDVQNGKIMGQRVIPLNRVGIYVPGGSAAYPSSVLMNAIPATVAGVNELVMVTPPKRDGINPAVIYAAQVAGIKTIITVGGAQAVAALAYGTESIPAVDKIVGPGNIFVAMAKKMVYGRVDIDMIAGPSEVLVIADKNAPAEYVAADLLSQAEHDKLAASVLITDSEEKAKEIDLELSRQLALLPRCEIASASVNAFGSAVVVDSIDDACKLANTIAPEHLELAVANPFDYLGKIVNAGSVFLGYNTTEPLGDYMAGPNHVLPTGGSARFFSALSVDSFVKRSSYLYFDRESFEDLAPDVIRFAQSEGLDAHANSCKIRLGMDL